MFDKKVLEANASQSRVQKQSAEQEDQIRGETPLSTKATKVEAMTPESPIWLGLRASSNGDISASPDFPF